MAGLIILLARNTLGYTKACLKTLFAQTVPVDVVAVDNASTDGTDRFLIAQAAVHSNLYRITTRRVESVAKCWNYALNWGWARGYNEALVVNNDTELLPITYEKLVAPLHAWKRGMLTAIGVDRPPVMPGTLTTCLHPHYSCYMIAKWAHQRVPFDEGYEGAYYEDSDHHVRMFREGIWTGSLSLEFLHHGSGTLQHADPVETERIARCYMRNKQRFYRQYGTMPGTRGYEKLFLPVDGDGAPDAEDPQKPDAQDQNHHHSDDGLHGLGHGDIGLDQPEDHSHND